MYFLMMNSIISHTFKTENKTILRNDHHYETQMNQKPHVFIDQYLRTWCGMQWQNGSGMYYISYLEILHFTVINYNDLVWYFSVPDSWPLLNVQLDSGNLPSVHLLIETTFVPVIVFAFRYIDLFCYNHYFKLNKLV